MTSDEWLNIVPKNSYHLTQQDIKEEYYSYEVVIQEPEKILSKDEMKAFFKNEISTPLR